ncbi:MAG: Bcr/CflA family multidrug efflux MFS transporter [Rhodospirillaceae bacterium]|nr:Bcr/CflA family multidrug efflux MFS transporter [Rhodospirillaceae bacterium]
MTPHSRAKTRGLALTLGAVTGLTPLAIDMYLPALPSMAEAFPGNTVSVQLTLASFFIGVAIGQAIYGPVADRYGRRWPLLVGCIIYTLASIGCALAPSMTALVGFRFLQALGGCAGMIIARAISRDLFDERGMARLMAMLMLVMGAAPIIAPTFGGQMLRVLDWRWIFWALALAGAACVAVIFVRLRETLPAERRRPLRLGSTLSTYRKLLADRRFMAYALPSGLAMTGMFAYVTGSPHVFIELHGVAPSDYGWLFGLNAIALIGASQVNHRLLAAHGGRRLLRRALPVVALAALVLLAMAAVPGAGLAALIIPLFVYIGALGFVLPNASAAAMAPFGAMAGAASSLLGILQFGSGAFVGAALGALQDDTALPMAGIVAFAGVSAALLHWLLRVEPQPTVAVEAGE